MCPGFEVKSGIVFARPLVFVPRFCRCAVLLRVSAVVVGIFVDSVLVCAVFLNLLLLPCIPRRLVQMPVCLPVIPQMRGLILLGSQVVPSPETSRLALLV